MFRGSFGRERRARRPARTGIPFVRAGDVPIETDNVARLPPVISRPIARERALPDDNTSFSSSSLCAASFNLQLFSIVSRLSVCSFIRELRGGGGIGEPVVRESRVFAGFQWRAVEYAEFGDFEYQVLLGNCCSRIN